MSDRRLFGSFAASSLARLLRAFARVGILVLVARLFPIEQVGEFAFLFGLGTLVAGLLDLGVTSMLQRESAVALDGAGALELGALNLRLTTLPIAVVTAWLAAWVITGSPYPAGLGTLAFAAALVLADFLSGVRRARGEFAREAHEVLAVVVGSAVAIAVHLLLDFDFDRFQWTLGGVTLIAALWQAQRLRAILVGLRSGVVSTARGSLVWRSRWFWLVGAGALLLFELPTVLLRWLGTAGDVALFAAAMRTVGLASHPFIVLGGVYVPSLAYQAEHDRGAYKRAVNSLNVLNLVSLPAGLALAVGGGALLLAGFGPAYAESLPVVWILALGTLVYLGTPSGGVLIVERLERALALSSLAAGLVLMMAAIVLVPTLGYRGAAIASAVGLLTGKLGHVVLYARARLPALPSGARKVLAAVCTWGIALFTSPQRWSGAVLFVGGFMSLLMTTHLLLGARLPFRPYPSPSATKAVKPGLGAIRPPSHVKTGIKRLLLSYAPGLYWLWRRVRHGQDRFENETPLLRFLCSPNAASLDVGANYGVYTYYMLPYSRMVYAFEPIEALSQLLRKAFRRESGRVVVHQVALSDRDGAAALRSPSGFPGRSTIEPGNTLTEGLPPETRIHLESVEVCRLDGMELPRVGMVKVDVEGHELEVLRGAVGILERDRPSLLVEIEERHRAGSVRLVCQLLKEYGYLAFQWNGHRLVPVDGEEAGSRDAAYQPGARRNYIFIHQERMATVEVLL